MGRDDAEFDATELDEAELDAAEFEEVEDVEFDEYDELGDAESGDAEFGDDEHGADRDLPWLLRARPIGWVLVVGGLMGFIASFMLTIEFIHKLQNPNESLICDINPFITCGPAMLSDAGHVLGFPNIILGLAAFSVTITTGVVTLVGARLPKWYWVCFQIGLVGAAVLITYLQWFSAYPLGKLCLWCMIIWTGTILLVTLSTISSMALGRLGDGLVALGRRLADWSWVILVLWYLAVIGFVLAGMWERFALAF